PRSARRARQGIRKRRGRPGSFGSPRPCRGATMRLTNLLRTSVSAAVVGAVAFGFAGAASAQDGQDRATTIDDIIVTAQKREQNLQDVPIVVTSLSQEALEDAGVRDIKDLQILTPGMTVTS